MDARHISSARLAWLAAALAASLLRPLPARAESPGDAEGTLVAQDGAELVVDIGSLRGASDGDVVELWRPVRLKHPLTGQTLQDRFRIGSLRLVQVRRALSLASVEGEPMRKPTPGDVVVLRKASPAPAASAGKAPAASAGKAPAAESKAPAESASAAPSGAVVVGDPEAKAVADLLASLRGAVPEVRAQRYEEFARFWPSGRAAPVLLEEAGMLRAQPAVAAAPKPPVEALGFVAPSKALSGRPLRLALEVLGGVVRGLVLHVRKPGEVTYTSIAMEPSGAGYYRAQIPAALVGAPAVTYFIEAVGPEGRAMALVGSAEAPKKIEVDDPPTAPGEGRGDVVASLWADYANYNAAKGLLKTNDYVVQTEGYFGLRLRDVGVRAVRSGFGVYRGVGGRLEDLDRPGGRGRPVGLTYGYLETELAPSSTLSFVGRAVIGLRDDGVGSGGQLYLRIGSDRRTNLAIGGEFLGGIGLRGITQLEWRTIARVPIVLRTEVSNQPAGVAAKPSDVIEGESTGTNKVALRTIVQVGYELSPSLAVAGRLSYQGRTINHAGPGFGAAVTYQW